MPIKTSTPRILIVVERGVVQSVVSTRPVLYQVKDFDDLADGGKPATMEAFYPEDLLCMNEDNFKKEVEAT